MTRIAISGYGGAMGQTFARLIENSDEFTLTGATEAPNSPRLGEKINDNVFVTDDVAKACENADVFIDFTIPKATMAALPKIAQTNCKAVIIGTTGFEDAQNHEIATYSDGLKIVKSGNFSLGVNLLAGFVKLAAGALDEAWDIEIIEAHHRRKIDAPSGTALLLGDAAAKGRGKSLETLRTPAREGINGAREIGKIGFCAIRGGAIIGEHDVRFESDSESLILSHKAHDRSIFAKGALKAAKWAINQPNGIYSMANVLGFEG